MRSASAETRPTARPRWWGAGLLLCIVLGAGGYLLWDAPERARLPGSSPERPATSREVDAAALVDRLAAVLADGTRAEARALAPPGDRAAARELAQLHGNAQRLRLTDLSFRYVDEQAGASVGGTPLPAGQWVADVEATWRLGGLEERPTTAEVTLTLAEGEDGVAFVSARQDHGRPAPLWLLDRLAVARGKRVLVMVAGRSAGAYPGQAEQALVEVARVLPDWDGPLVVQVPGSAQALDRVLDAEAGAFDAIAAVTTPADGSRSAGAPVHVFVNPAVYEPLGERGEQVVMTHEAVHVATEATMARLPAWLVEGFADYVALAPVDLPLEVTAGQALEEVRRSGVPERLPGPGRFGTDHHTLGASYEAAWLACRLIARDHGEDALVRFYGRADEAGTDVAFREVLGTTERAFTRSWQRHLAGLAGTTDG